MRTPWVTKDAGRWITIGGTKGADGKRHGGSPVFIKNGRIEKGHPSLTGKRIDNLRGEAEEAPKKERAKPPTKRQAAAERGAQTRRENASSDEYSRAKWRKRAREMGHDPKALESLANDIKSHHDAFAAERKDVLQFARSHSKGNQFADLTRRGADKQTGGAADAAALRGFDQVAEATQKAFPHHFREETGEHGSYSDQLYDMLNQGHSGPMDWDAAYSDAMDAMGEPGKHDDPETSFNFGANVKDEFEIPKRLTLPWVTKERRDSSYTGVTFGRYYVSGQQVTREQYLAATGKPGGKGKPKAAARRLPSDRTKVTIQHATRALEGMGYKLGKASFDHASKRTRYELIHPDGSAKAVSADEIKDLIYGTKPTAKPASPAQAAKPAAAQDMRPNPVLDEFMAGPSPAAAKPAAKPQQDMRHNPALDEFMRATEGGSREPAKPKAGPPPLPHERTMQTALDHANAVVAAAKSGDKHALRQAHSKAKAALQAHFTEGNRAIRRLAAAKYPTDKAAASRAAAKAMETFRGKIRAAHSRLLDYSRGMSAKAWGPQFDLHIGSVE